MKLDFFSCPSLVNIRVSLGVTHFLPANLILAPAAARVQLRGKPLPTSNPSPQHYIAMRDAIIILPRYQYRSGKE